MIRGKKTLTVLLSIVLCLSLVAIAIAKQNEIRTAQELSPNAVGDPNWDLKAEMMGEHVDGYVPLVVGDEFVAPPVTNDELLKAAVNSFSNVTSLPAGTPPVLRDCPVVCPPNGIDDGEACGDDTNGGCNMAVPGFTTVACGDTVCGTIWADGGSRDTDWYELTLTEANLVEWYCEAEFDAVIGFVDTADCALAGALDPYTTFLACETGSVSRVAGPGTYWLFVSHQTYYDVPCGTDNDFWAAVTCTPLTEGACCDPATGDCTGPVEEADCLAMYGGTGVWHAGVDCDPNPCPPPAGPGDSCAEPLSFTLPADLPYESKNNYTCGRQNHYSEADMCYTYGYGGGEDAVYEMVVTAAGSFDFNMDPKGTTWTYFEIRTECEPPNGDCIGYARNTAGGAYDLLCVALDPGTYYIIVDSWPSPDCIPDFDLTITECDPGNPGDNCLNPLTYSISSADVGTTIISGETNCGRGNNYDATCLGSYDGGEDIIIEVVPTEDMCATFILDPKGTSYSGIAVDDACPPASSCLGYVTGSSGDPKSTPPISMTAGTSYYIMVDTWPTPDCVPDFDIALGDCPPPPPNDDCANAEAIGNVTDYPYSTEFATFDGPGGCLTSPNLWYTYEATCDGEVTVDLCGSLYDTKLAVYEGTTCWGPEIACNDDACGLQSSVTFDALTGETFLIEVGGYSAATGDGDITISCYVPPPPPYNDLCEDAVISSCPVTITGTNESSTNEAPDCLGDCGHAWEAFTITENKDVTIDFCGTSPAFELVYISLYDECPVGAGCEPLLADATDWTLCGDNVTMYFYNLPAGTYYLPVLACYPGYESYYMEGPYTINIDCQEPTYCPASGGCDEYIENVLLEDINNTSACDGYGDYTAVSTILEPGGTYPMQVTIGNAYSSDQTAAWIDFDQSLSFDPDELVLYGTGTGPISGSFVVPSDALIGETRMRVRLTWNEDATTLPCGATTYGEAEDYTIDIQCFPADEDAQTSVDPMYMYYAFQIDPYMIDVYIDPTQWDPYHTVPYIDLSSIEVNGYPVTGVVGPPVFGYSCEETIYCTMWIYNFLTPYGAPLGFNPQTFNVTGDFTTSGSWAVQGDVGLYGKDPYRPSMWIVPPDEVILRADCDRSGFVNISDATFLIQFIFNNGEAPLPRMVADADCNLMVNVTDAVYLIQYIFSGGPQPCPAGE